VPAEDTPAITSAALGHATNKITLRGDKNGNVINGVKSAHNLSIAGDDDVILERTAVFFFSAEVNIGERYSDITLDAIDHIAVLVATQRIHYQ